MLVLAGHYIHYEQREQVTITAVRENISLWEGVLVLAGPIHPYEQSEIFTITAVEREYFTLGGCAGPGRTNTAHPPIESKPQ